MARPTKYLLFFLLGGLLLSSQLSHELMPARQSLTPVVMRDGWMSTAEPSHRGYFRHTLEIPFQPEHAWLSIAAEDYRLYVNGYEAGNNVYLLKPWTAFQDRLSDQAQSLTEGDVVSLQGVATLAKAAKQEWRMAQFYDLRPYLKQGRNVLAVYVQSERLNRWAVYGGVTGDAAEMEISGRPAVWRASTEATTKNGLEWHDPRGEDLDWKTPRASAAPEDLPLYALGDPDIWREPFRMPAITSPVLSEEQIFRTALVAERKGQGSWLRVRSSWPFDLFVGKEWIGGGGADRVEAFDISAALHDNAEWLTLRIYRGTGSAAAAAEEVPWLAVDGRIGLVPVSTSKGWEYLSGNHPDWLQGSGTWSKG